MFIPAADAVVAHRYRLIEEIGRGGMGAVWKAVDTQLDAPCALKFILDQQGKPKHVRSRFLREAQAAARLQSPHVVSVRSVGEWDEALYIAMELLTGETLAERLKRTRTLTPRQTLQVVQQVALVLNMSHHANIVHRDLKPENIWLWSGADLFVKVLDFGVAKQLRTNNAETNTNSGMLVGTPYYMSPEQAAGDRDVDHRVDLWALTVIAVECLSGQRPFQSAGLGQLLSNIINRRFQPLAELYPASTPALEAWWLRATAAEPDARYTSAESLTRNLAVALELEPAPPRSTTKLATKRVTTKSPPPKPKPKVEQVATVEPDVGFDVWRKPAPKTTSGQPVTADIEAIPLKGFIGSNPLKVAAGLGALAVVGALSQFVARSQTAAAPSAGAGVALLATPNGLNAATSHQITPSKRGASNEHGSSSKLSAPNKDAVTNSGTARYDEPRVAINQRPDPLPARADAPQRLAQPVVGIALPLTPRVVIPASSPPPVATASPISHAVPAPVSPPPAVMTTPQPPTARKPHPTDPRIGF